MEKKESWRLVRLLSRAVIGVAVLHSNRINIISKAESVVRLRAEGEEGRSSVLYLSLIPIQYPSEDVKQTVGYVG